MTIKFVVAVPKGYSDTHAEANLQTIANEMFKSAAIYPDPQIAITNFKTEITQGEKA
jgi:hypothetical protein